MAVAQAPAFQDCGCSRGQSPLSLESVCSSLIGLIISAASGKPRRGPLRLLPRPGPKWSRLLSPPWQGLLDALEVRRGHSGGPQDVVTTCSDPELSQISSAAREAGGGFPRPSSRIHLDWLSSSLRDTGVTMQPSGLPTSGRGLPGKEAPVCAPCFCTRDPRPLFQRTV